MQNGTSNVTIATNANISHFVTGNTTSQLTVTATGTNTAGYANVVGNANVGNLGTAGLIVATGNITGGNLVTGGLLSVTGNANVANLNASAGVSTVTLTASGNANVGNLGTAGLIVATGNITGGNLVTGGVLTVTGTGVSSIAGNLDMTGNTIINLATPTNASDAATKQYVDDVAQGLNVHDSCIAATPATLTSITGGAITYNNGTAGVGATLVTGTGSFTTIDGVNIATVGARILVKDEANAAHNGIYTYTNSTTLTRAADFNTVPEVEAGDFVFVSGGSTYNDTGWVQTQVVVTIGTDPISFAQFSGSGSYSAGSGLTLTGSVFSVNVAQPTITSVGTLTSLTVSGNATAGNLITGGTLSATGNANVGNLGTGGLIVATGNITGANLITGGLLSVTGNANVGILNSAGNVIGTRLISNIATGTAPLTVTSTTRVANLNVDYANVADFITVAAGTNNNFLVFANAATGNVTEVTSTGLTANLSNNSITATTFVGALSGAATSATTAGTVTTAAQPNITSTGTLTSLAVTGNVSAGNLAISGTANINGGVTGTATATTTGTATTTLVQFAAPAGTGVEFIVKASETTGSKFSITTLLAISSGSTVDYTNFGTVTIGTTPGIVSATFSGSNIQLQVTASSSASTVWTTQYRYI